MAYLTMSLEENSEKRTSTSFGEKSGLADADAAALAVINAVDAMTLGMLRSAGRVVDVAGFTPATGIAPIGAQRGQKWLISGTATATGEKHSRTVGTADSADISGTGSDELDLTAGDALALKTALDAYWADEADNPITTTAISYRNYTLQ